MWLLAEVVATYPTEAVQGRAVLEAAARNPQLDSAMRGPFLVNCGRSYLVDKDPGQALVFFQEASAVQPDNPTALTWTCVAHMHLGQRSQALTAARLAAEAAATDGRLGAQLGLLQFCNDQVDEAVATWNQLLAGEEASLSPWDVGAMCANDPVIAGAAFAALLRASGREDLPNPVRTAIHGGLGQILFKMGKYDPALSALETAAKLSPSDEVTGLWWRARALTSLGRLEPARMALEQAYQLDSDRITVVVDLATARYSLGEVPGATKVLADYYDAHSSDTTAANNLAWMLAEQAEADEVLDRALRLAKYACKRHSNSPGFADTLGWVHLKRADAESAIFSFRQAVQLDPENGEYQYHLGMAYELEGDVAHAQQSFTKAVELAPTPRPDWYDAAVRGASGQ